MLVMSRFYKRDQIQFRMTLLFTAASLAGAFSGLLASAILGMDGRAGHKGWQWIFILVRDPFLFLPVPASPLHCWQKTDEFPP
jgi:MFS family permease